MRKIISLLLLSIIIISAMLGVSAEKAAENGGQLEVKYNVGFNDVYKIGYSTPINIDIKNKNKDINGQVEIRVPSSPGKYMSYVKPISLQKGAEKSITINVPIGNEYRSKYAINIYDGEKKIYENTITTVANNNITTFIGILSDDFDSLSYINSVPASTGVSLITKTIKLDEKNFPEDVFTLKAFNILVINDFDSSRLSKTQYDTLKQWVKNGGTLIVGTGSKYNKTLSIFKDDFIEGTQGSIQEITTSRIYELATNGDNKNETKLDVLTLNIKDSTTVLEDRNVKLVQAHSKGRGVVGILSFDLGKAPFVNWSNNTAFMEKVLELVNPALTSPNSSTDMGSFFRNNTYAIQEAVNQFSEMAAARTSSYYLILFLYVLFVAPISYFILKKLDKREWMWLTVPVLAIIFGALVFVTGTGTRSSKITTNMISYVTLDKSGSAYADTFVGVLNTNKSKVKISGQNGERIIPLLNNYYSDQTFEKEVLEATVFSGENGGIEYINSSLLETKVLQLQENQIELGKIETDLNIRNGKISGTIKNSTGLELIDCVVLMPEGYYKIESLKNGETFTLNAANYANHNGNIYEMTQDVYFRQTASGKSEAERKRNMDLRQEGNILQRMYDYGNAQIDGIKLIGFSKSEIHKPLFVNGVEAKKHERNVVIMPIDIKFKNGDITEYPMGFVPYEVISTSNLHYETQMKRFYGNGSAEIQYSLDKNMTVEEFQVKTSTMQYKSSNSSYSIYNVQKQAYQPLSDMVVSGENLKDYLSPDNTIKIKLEVTDGEIGIPQIAAKGRSK